MYNQTQRTLAQLTSGDSLLAKKYAGHQVLVVKNKVFPLPQGKKAIKDYARLKKKYKEAPVITFVPQQGISYILLCG